VDPDPIELRVVGCLIEKQRTTPDAYPLTLNSLRLACNQSTNRDPVVNYSEAEIRGALTRLNDRGWAQLATWTERRTKKYRQLLRKKLELSDGQEALLCLLMLRGPQTPAELRQRAERLHHFSADELELTLAELAERELVRELPRQPGQRGQRWMQLLAGDSEEEGETSAVAGSPPPFEPSVPRVARRPPGGSTADEDDQEGSLTDRVARLERQVSVLKQHLADLRRELGEL